jgi:hypothetical protein
MDGGKFGTDLFLAVGSKPHSSHVRWVRVPCTFLGRQLAIDAAGFSSVAVFKIFGGCKNGNYFCDYLPLALCLLSLGVSGLMVY